MAAPVSSHGICWGGGICAAEALERFLALGEAPAHRGPGEPMRTTSASDEGPVGMLPSFFPARRSRFLVERAELPREGKASESSTGGTSDEELFSRYCWRELGRDGVILKPGGGPITPPDQWSDESAGNAEASW
jgi:hypothetical protein